MHEAVQIVRSIDLPGIAFYAFPELGDSHCTYQPHLRHLRLPPPHYTGLHRELYEVASTTDRIHTASDAGDAAASAA
ncbi:MAG: hypothetical protein ACRD6W_11710 [Nitrososphaerales archaeon]